MFKLKVRALMTPIHPYISRNGTVIHQSDPNGRSPMWPQRSGTAPKTITAQVAHHSLSHAKPTTTRGERPTATASRSNYSVIVLYGTRKERNIRAGQFNIPSAQHANREQIAAKSKPAPQKKPTRCSAGNPTPIYTPPSRLPSSCNSSHLQVGS